MLTRCPACATHFRITPAQLKARAGSVRCGACQHVFNALDSLIEEPMVVVAPSTPESSQQDVPATLPGTDMEASGYSDTRLEPAPASAVPSEALVELATPQPAAQEPSSAEPAETPEAAIVELIEAGAGSWSETFPEPPPPPRRWPWLVGSTLALLVLGLQAALVFRVELAVLWPKAKPALIALCNMANCDIGLPAKIGLVGIEASDLHPENGQAGRLGLTATLKNRAPFVQQFPHLELTLTDLADQTIARKVLAPADYLPPGTSIASGMPPNADIMVAAGVIPSELSASGYRLYVFYP